MRFGPIELISIEDFRIEGMDTSGNEAVGNASAYEAKYGDAHVEVLDIQWSTGSHDVRAARVISGSPAVESLARGRLRLGVNTNPETPGESWCELRLAKIKPRSTEWSNLFNANVAELRKAVGFDLISLLLDRTEVTEVGTKSQILGREDKTKNRLCMLFPTEARICPMLAFIGTRILPLQNGITVSDEL